MFVSDKYYFFELFYQFYKVSLIGKLFEKVKVIEKVKVFEKENLFQKAKVFFIK